MIIIRMGVNALGRATPISTVNDEAEAQWLTQCVNALGRATPISTRIF